MIPRKQSENQIGKYITEPLELLQRLNLTPAQVLLSDRAIAQFRFKVPVSFADKIQPGVADDPLLLQILPVAHELDQVPGFKTDPLSETDYLSRPGLLQKYPGRALLLVTPSCAINCRYCFRRHYPYADKGHFWKRINDNIQLLKQDTSVTEVILSGGDPLSLADDKLSEIISKLETIPHLQTIRIHTRYPVVEPQRITRHMVKMLGTSRLRAIMVLHVNHAREIDQSNRSGLALLRAHRVTLLNQSVLLKGVNNSVSTLKDLSECLFDHAILPYYLHMLDKVQGSAHFEVEEAEAFVIYQQLREQLPGYLLPRLVREVPGELSKTAILENSGR